MSKLQYILPSLRLARLSIIHTRTLSHLSPHLARPLYRTMSSTSVPSTAPENATLPSTVEASKLFYFFVYAPDYTDSEALSRRLAVRTKHLEEARPWIVNGISSALRLGRSSSCLVSKRLTKEFRPVLELVGEQR